MEEINKEFILKGVGEPEYYLGGNVIKLDTAWQGQGIFTGLFAETCIKTAFKKLQEMVGSQFPTKCNSLMSKMCHPEEDNSLLLNLMEASMHRAFIGSANWVVTLGRMDVAYATNALARFSMAPRQGHLKAAKQAFRYFLKWRQSMIVVDPHYRDWSRHNITEYDTWTKFYPNVEEAMPDKTLTP